MSTQPSGKRVGLTGPRKALQNNGVEVDMLGEKEGAVRG